MRIKFSRRALVAAAAALSFANPVLSGGHQVVDSIHFLIPGGAGGGWDGTDDAAALCRVAGVEDGACRTDATALVAPRVEVGAADEHARRRRARQLYLQPRGRARALLGAAHDCRRRGV